jgi:hypothetical protein
VTKLISALYLQDVLSFLDFHIYEELETLSVTEIISKAMSRDLSPDVPFLSSSTYRYCTSRRLDEKASISHQ